MKFILIVAIILAYSGYGFAVKDYQKKALSGHNAYRAKHGSPSLKLDHDLNKKALKCAKYYAMKKSIGKHDCPYRHGVGENLVGGPHKFSQKHLTKIGLKMWYDEIRLYKFNKPGFSMGTGHFTQMVWKRSKKLGFGVVSIGGYTVGVALYHPQGNIQSQFPKNVKRAKTTKKSKKKHKRSKKH